MAASVPVPIAMPRSACARAAASLTPSPTNTADCPSSRSRLMTAALPSGRTPASTSARAIPTCPATAAATRSLSPVSSMGRRPRARSRATAAPAPGRSSSATVSAARAWPSHPTRTAVRPSSAAALDGVAERGRHLDEQLGEQPGAAHGNVPVPDAAPHPGPGQGREPGDLRQAAEPGGGRRAMAWPIGCSEPSSTAPASSSASRWAASPAPARGEMMTAVTVMVPVVRVPVLSSTTVADPPGRLERAGALDQDAEFGAAADRGHQRGRGGQAERARAGDHEDGDGGAPGRGGGQARPQPESEGRHGQGDHARHEDGGDPVGEPLGARLGRLGLGDQPG